MCSDEHVDQTEDTLNLDFENLNIHEKTTATSQRSRVSSKDGRRVEPSLSVSPENTAVDPVPSSHGARTHTPQRFNDLLHSGFQTTKSNRASRSTTPSSTGSVRRSVRIRDRTSPVPSYNNHYHSMDDEEASDNSPSKNLQRDANRQFIRHDEEAKKPEDPSDVHMAVSEDDIEPLRSPLRKKTKGVTCLELDAELRWWIRRPLTSGQNKKSAEGAIGYVYIFANPEHLEDGYWKIGTTNDLLRGRATSLGRKCKTTIEIHSQGAVVSAASRAENLCQAHLKHYHTPFDCPTCLTPIKKDPVRHKEYFKIDFKIAKDYVDLWSKFLHHRPYDEAGNLHQFWLDELQKVPEPATNALGDHDEQLRRWGKFVDCGRKQKWVSEKSRRGSSGQMKP